MNLAGRSAGLEDAIEFLRGRLYYVYLKKHPSRTSGAQFLCIDDELIYWNFYLDFGPLHLGHTFVFADMLNKKLAECDRAGERLYFYSSAHGQRRANAVCILACYGILFQKMTPKAAFSPFADMKFPPFHDATPSVCTFNLSILDCLEGLDRAIRSNYISVKTFDTREFLHFEKVENGDLTWVSPKFIAFAGPHNQYKRTPQGHVMLPPEHYIPYFKQKNVTLVVRLNEKQYDEKKFLAAGIDHLDLVYPDGTNAPFPILLKFIEACERTPGAVAVHCKAGLGRTGTCIGAYMMKHDLFTAHELIGWLRLCRPGSIIGPQQQYMEAIESRIHQLNPKFNAPDNLRSSSGGSSGIRGLANGLRNSLSSIHPVRGSPSSRPNSGSLLSPLASSKLLPSLGDGVTNSNKLIGLDTTQGDRLNDQKKARGSVGSSMLKFNR